MQKLKIDPKFEPSPPRSGDELYPNSIFEFNITRLLAYIATKPSDVAIEEVDLSGLARYSSSLDEAYIASADLSQPVILAEIAPTNTTSSTGTIAWRRHDDSGYRRFVPID